MVSETLPAELHSSTAPAKVFWPAKYTNVPSFEQLAWRQKCADSLERTEVLLTKSISTAAIKVPQGIDKTKESRRDIDDEQTVYVTGAQNVSVARARYEIMKSMLKMV